LKYQEWKIKEFATSKGYEIENIFQDFHTFINSSSFNSVLIVSDLTRLGRGELLKYHLKVLEDRGITLYTPELEDEYTSPFN
jgi:DNA invertase Pin-like site-specific DNA recombinase